MSVSCVILWLNGYLSLSGLSILAPLMDDNRGLDGGLVISVLLGKDWRMLPYRLYLYEMSCRCFWILIGALTRT